MFKYKLCNSILFCSILFCSQQSLFANDQVSQDVKEMTGYQCQQDIHFISDFLLKNDAGIRAKNWNQYPENIQSILEMQSNKALSVQDVDECKEVISVFLKSIRKGHLYVDDKKIKDTLNQQQDSIEESDQIITKKLSNLTTYIQVPSFDLSYKPKLEDIIKNNQSNIKEAQFLIVDVRNNGGGDDETYRPLMMLFGEHEYLTETPMIYVTQENIQAWQAIEMLISDENAKKWYRQLLEKMRNNENRWVAMSNSHYEKNKITAKDAVSQKKKIVILTDASCGSSCEQFVLEAKDNPKIVTMGRNTYGALDASNLREKQMPSHLLNLLYATTFIYRNNGVIIDDVGIKPNIVLVKPKDQKEQDEEIELAQRLLEQDKI